MLTQRRDARWSPSPPAGLVRSARALTLMLGSKPGMLSLSLTSHCVYVAHGSRAPPQNFNPPAPGTPSFMLLAAARAQGRLRIVRNLPNSGSLIRLRVVWRLFLANTSSDSLRSTEIRRFVQRPKTQSLVGSIINISSSASTITPPNASVYSATEAAVDAVTRTLAKELAARHSRECDQPRDGRDGRPAYRRLRRERVSETDRCWTYQA